MLLREQLTSEFVGQVLDDMKNNGWLTQISDEVGVNRRELTRKGLADMKLSRALRLLVGLCDHQCRRSYSQWYELWMQLGRIILDMAENHYYEMVDERRNVKQK